MAKTASKRGSAKEPPRLRVLLGAAVAIGHGKADLLDAIAETGSISAAAKRMGMSYRRAWLLVDTMNGSFHGPLVASARGGSGGGGAELTALGREVLARYREMEAKALECLADDLDAFSKLMR
jgi:molybdate transport system regulatory protein